jgi:hypothetical protein
MRPGIEPIGWEAEQRFRHLIDALGRARTDEREGDAIAYEVAQRRRRLEGRDAATANDDL